MHATGNTAGRAPPTGPRALTQNRSPLSANSMAAATNSVNNTNSSVLSASLSRSPIKINLSQKNTWNSSTPHSTPSTSSSPSSSSAIPVQTGFIPPTHSPSHEISSTQLDLPPWPGLPSKGRAQRTVYDPYLDKAASSSSKKANECVYRYDALDPDFPLDDVPSSSQSRDPRLGRVKEGRGTRKLRAGFHQVIWSWDSNSTQPPPPPPPRAILITNLNPLTPSATIRRQFQEYGHIEEFSSQTDPVTGAPLGICWVKYSGERQVGSDIPAAGEKAAKQVVKAASRNSPNSTGIKVGVGTEGRVVDVVYDPHGKLCKKRVQEELDRRRGLNHHTSSSPSAMSPPKPDSPSKDSYTGGGTPRSGLNGLPFNAKHGLPPRPDVHSLPRTHFSHSSSIPSAASPSATSNTTLPTPVHSSIPSISPLHPSQEPSSSSSSRPINGNATPVHPSLPQRPQVSSNYLNSNAQGIGHGSLHPLPQAVQAQREFAKVKERKERRSTTPEWKKRDPSPRRRDEPVIRDWRDPSRSRSRSRSPIITDWRDRSRSRGRSETRSWSREQSRTRSRSHDWRRTTRSPHSERNRSWSRSRSGERRSTSYYDRDRRKPYSSRSHRQSPSSLPRRPAPTSPYSSKRRSRSPPTSLSSGSPQKNAKEDTDTIRQLAENGHDHVRIKRSALPRVLLAKTGTGYEEVETELREYFDAFGVDKVLRDSTGWYVTFNNPSTAKRCRIVLEHRPFMLHHPPLGFIVSPAPPLPPPSSAETNDKSVKEESDESTVKAAVPIVMASLKEMFRDELENHVVSDKISEIVDTVVGSSADAEIGLAVDAEIGLAVDAEIGLAVDADVGLAVDTEVENGPASVNDEVDELVDDETPIVVVEAVKIEQIPMAVQEDQQPVVEEVKPVEVKKPKKSTKKKSSAASGGGDSRKPSSKKSSKAKKALQASNNGGLPLNGIDHHLEVPPRSKKRKVVPGTDVDSDLDDLLLLSGGEMASETRHDSQVVVEGDEVDLLMDEIRERPGPPPKKKHKQSKNASPFDASAKSKSSKKGTLTKPMIRIKPPVTEDVDAALEELVLEPENDHHHHHHHHHHNHHHHHHQPQHFQHYNPANDFIIDDEESDDLDFSPNGRGQTANRSVNEEAAFDLEAELGVGLDQSPVAKKAKKMKHKQEVDLDVEAELLKAVEEDEKEYSSAGVVDVDEELGLEVDLVEAGEEEQRQEQKSRKRSRSVLDEMDLDLDDLGLDLGLTDSLEHERNVPTRIEHPSSQQPPVAEQQVPSVQDQRPADTVDISLVSGRARKKPKTLLWNGGDANGMVDYRELDKELFGDLAIVQVGAGGKKKRQSKGSKADRDGAYHFSAKGSGGGTNGSTGSKPPKEKDSTPTGTPNGTSGRSSKARSKKSKHHGGHSSHALSATPAAGAAEDGATTGFLPPEPLAPLVIPVTIGQRPNRPIIPSLKDLEESDQVAVEQERESRRLNARSSPGPSSVTATGLPRRSSSPDPITLQLALDDEELFFLKAGLARRRGEDVIPVPIDPTPYPHENQSKKTELRVHRTGSSRTEGYYKIPEALKSAYLPQRNRAVVLDTPNAAKLNAEAAGLAGTANSSSRSNRVNTRRLVQGMEQAKNAMGGDAQTTQLQFNQLRARKKQLIFARSPIHDWGLYAMEAIPQGEMVIEYVGEVIRAQVADKREKWYERIGIGSSYLFRVDEDSVVDATKKGNLGRLINHSCTPNCNAKIIVVNSQKKIVIYAKSSIEPGEEITYDYHFPLEQEKIPCLCGSSRCRGFLN
ncbi:histone methyltransferase set1 [Tulasnella sp. 418]|nr:histone methyltransferase set1 [Tulasnella sp. 418]